MTPQLGREWGYEKMKSEDFWSLSSGLRGVRWKDKRSGVWRVGCLRVRLQIGYSLRKTQGTEGLKDIGWIVYPMKH